MGLFTPTRAETVADQHLYLDGRLREVACLDCLARVLVKKNSEHHTAVQWNAESVAACSEFVALANGPHGRAVHAPCRRLMATIDRAVREGELSVGAADGY